MGMKILTTIFLGISIFSFVICVLAFRGEFNVGHGGIPMLSSIIAVSLVATFIIVGGISYFYFKMKLRTINLGKRVVGLYWSAIFINILINLITLIPLIRCCT